MMSVDKKQAVEAVEKGADLYELLWAAQIEPRELPPKESILRSIKERKIILSWNYR